MLTRISPTYLGKLDNNGRKIRFETFYKKIKFRKPCKTLGNINYDITKVKKGKTDLVFVVSKIPNKESILDYQSIVLTDVVNKDENKIGGKSPIFYEIEKDKILNSKELLQFNKVVK